MSPEKDSAAQLWKPSKLHLVCVLLTGLAAVFLIAASTTPYGHFKAGFREVIPVHLRSSTYENYYYRKVKQEARLTRLTQCIADACKDYKWSETKCDASRVNAALAFVILGAIVSSKAALVMGMAYFRKSFPAFVTGRVASVLAAICCLVGWSITFSLIEKNLCDGGHRLVMRPGDDPVAHMGNSLLDSKRTRILSPSYALQIVALIVLSANAVLAFSAQKPQTVVVRRFGFTSLCLGTVFTICSLASDQRGHLPVVEGVCGCILLFVSVVVYVVSECSCWQKIAEEDESSTTPAADVDNANLRRIGVVLAVIAIAMILVALTHPTMPGLRALAFAPLALAMTFLFLSVTCSCCRAKQRDVSEPAATSVPAENLPRRDNNKNHVSIPREMEPVAAARQAAVTIEQQPDPHVVQPAAPCWECTCGSVVSTEFCTRCGAQPCPRCGRPVREEDGNFCGRCGKALPVVGTVEPATCPKSS